MIFKDGNLPEEETECASGNLALIIAAIAGGVTAACLTATAVFAWLTA